MTAGRFDPLALIDALNTNSVDYVVIGGIAATIHGSDAVTSDLDICYRRSPEQMERLARTLGAIGVSLRGAPPDLPFVLDVQTLRNGDTFTFDTPAGPLDCIGTPIGSNGYDDLIRSAIHVDVDGRNVVVCSLDDLIRLKRAAGRPKDLWGVEQLKALKALLDSTSE